MKTLKLVDVINLCGITLQNFKIHCATGSNPTPLETFFDGKFQEWQEHQTKRNFKCQRVLSLIHLGGDRWLFAGVFEVYGDKQRRHGKKVWYQYSTKEVGGLESLTGRVIVDFTKNFRASYLRGEKYIDQLRVAELRADRVSVGDFPGYGEVMLSHRLLCTVVREAIPSWKSALANVSGVYLVTDVHTGKLYVGNASGGEGIWQRWSAYTKTGHGGNKELKGVLKAKGLAYANDFQYAVLEVFDLNASMEYASKRETHWKEVLRSREFGYNAN